MALRAPTPCRYPGCAVLLTTPGYCERHLQSIRKRQDERRGSAASRGYGSRWQRTRAVFLSQHPLCAECGRRSIVKPATVVDHIKPHRGIQDLFWNPSNWQALCKRCHDAKTAREDGGFGRLIAPGPQKDDR